MKIDRNELIGLVILCIGLVFLIVTFIMAFLYLTDELDIITHPDLVESLGEILGPIAKAIIRTMFLAVMGWIGALTTIRGMQFMRVKKEPTLKNVPQPPPVRAPPAIEAPKPRRKTK